VIRVADVVTPERAYIYCLLDPATGRPVYVGHSKDPAARVGEHWKQRRNSYRNRENPKFYGWLSSLLLPPDVRILATVAYERRYQEERAWTIRLRQRYDLFNISDGPAPIRRPWMTERNRRRRGNVRAVAA
jgi:GIY-YIG catalytic domain